MQHIENAISSIDTAMAELSEDENYGSNADWSEQRQDLQNVIDSISFNIVAIVEQHMMEARNTLGNASQMRYAYEHRRVLDDAMESLSNADKLLGIIGE